MIYYRRSILPVSLYIVQLAGFFLLKRIERNMSKEKGVKMDQEVKTELENIEGRLELALQKSIQTAIKEGFREIRDHIAALFNKDIDHINEHLGRHDDSIKNIKKNLEELKNSQIVASVSHDTADKIEDKLERKKELSYGKVGALVAVASAISGGIVFLISYF